jgi:hypothetical protein
VSEAAWDAAHAFINYLLRPEVSRLVSEAFPYTNPNLEARKLLTPDELASVEATIRAINPAAKLHRTTRCQLPISDVLDRNAFDLDRILDIEPDFLEEGHHHHHVEDIRSMSFEIRGDVDPDKFMPWIQELTQVQGGDILRWVLGLSFVAMAVWTLIPDSIEEEDILAADELADELANTASIAAENQRTTRASA